MRAQRFKQAGAATTVLGVTVALVTTLSPASAAPDAGGAPTAPVHLSATDAGLAVAASTPEVREYRLSELEAAPVLARRAGVRRGPVDLVSRPRPVSGYGVVGATWQGSQPDGVQYAVRTRTDGGAWSEWTPLHGADCANDDCGSADGASEHGPDAGSREFRNARPGTDAMAVGEVDKVQLKVTSRRGVVPEDLTLAVVDPEPTVTGGSLLARRATTTGGSAATTSESSAASSSSSVPRPKIYTRAQWGADERMRSGQPSYGTIHAGFVHHTVNTNDYTEDQVPSILRGIYAYHTQSRGWSDIGYNFLVDRFGRIWEGRYGGIDRPVIGAHTYGYNHLAFAMSAIGNFDVAEPPAAMVDAYARLYAWKLSLSGVRANSTQNLSGKDYAAISGHRDAGQTACPGQYLYAKLPAIRKKAARIQSGMEVPPPAPTPSEPAPSEPAPSEPAPTSPPSEPAPTKPAPSQPPAPVYRRGPDLPRDLSGDGSPDLLVRDRETGQLQVLGADRGPGFDPAVATGLRGDRIDLIAGVGDLTGDGEPDLLTRVRRSGVTQLRPGRANGTFARPLTAVDTSKFRDADLLAGAGNLIRNRRPDLLARDAGTRQLLVYPGRRGGKFGAGRVLLMDARRLRSVAGAGDVDGDGRDDVLAVAGQRLLLYPGLGKGKLAAPQVLSREWADRDLTFAGQDLTGDDVPDLLARDRSTGQTWIYMLEADGTPGPRFGGWETWTALSEIAVLGDTVGGTRVVARSERGEIVTLQSTDSDWLAPARDTDRRAPEADFIALAGDWDGDGHVDVITRTGKNGYVWLHPGTGDGRFGDRVRLFRNWTDRTDLAVSGDLTGDDLPDLLARDADGIMYLYPGDGAGGTTKRRVARERLFTTDLVVPVGYWNDDAVRDLIVRRTRDQRLYLVPGTTSGTLGRPVPLTDRLDAYDRIVSAGDRNGDGHPDLLATEAGTGRLWLLPGTASGLGAAEYLAPGLGRFDLLA